MHPTIVKEKFWGCRIKERYTALKKNIFSMTKLWITPAELKSGENTTGLLNAIRTASFTSLALTRTASTKQAVMRQQQCIARHNKSNANKKAPLTEDQCSKATEKTYTESLNGLKRDEWYPEGWLAFLLFG